MKMNYSQNDILLMGIPRSGTTLACALIGAQPNTIALVEPFDVAQLGEMAPDLATNTIRGWMNQARSDILVQRRFYGRIPNDESAVQSGSELTNTFSPKEGKGGKRAPLMRRGYVHFDKQLVKDFMLVAKHPNAFAGLLPHLKMKFRCFALVRNPVEILLSWATLDSPLSIGHAPIAERMDAELATLLAGTNDVRQRMIALLNWYFDRFDRYLRVEQIIRYEKMTAEPLKAIETVVGSGHVSQVHSQIKIQTKKYDQRLVEGWVDLLLTTGGAYEKFYDKKSIVDLIG